jgi:hypothetical protein
MQTFETPDQEKIATKSTCNKIHLKAPGSFLALALNALRRISTRDLPATSKPRGLWAALGLLYPRFGS